MQIFGLNTLYSYRRRRNERHEDSGIHLRRGTEGYRGKHNSGRGHRAYPCGYIGTMRKDRVEESN